MGFITNDRIDCLLKRGDVDGALNEPIRAIEPKNGGVAAFVSARSGRNGAAEDVAYSGLTLGDFLYDYIRIDPDVVRGVEFARAADVDGVLSFARFADTKADLSGASLDGLHSELQGYVAEQVAAHHLLAQGHDVLFPETPNNPGWDLLVDGHPFQVKCLADSGGVFEHLDRYPKIPVIVNAELGHQVGDHAGVYVDPALHHDAVRHATEEALDRGRDVADFEIPWISVGVSGAFNLYYMIRNDTDLIGMLTCTATDTVGRTVGGTAGQFAGAAAGAVLFGPAGAIVVGLIGAMGGAAAGRRMIAKGRELLVAEEEQAVRAAARRVAEAAVEAMPEKVEAWSQKSGLLDQSLAGAGANRHRVHAAMMHRMRQHIEYWRCKKTQLEAVASTGADSAQQFCERVLTLVRRAGIHPHHVHNPMAELGQTLERYQLESKRFRTPPATQT
jgi:hypothetical protein